jgi:outer membrane protein W
MLQTRCSASMLVALAAFATMPAFARAQDAGKGFLFGAPVGSITIRGGWAAPRAQSDFFAFTTERLTLDRGDFSSPTLDVDLAFRISPRTDIVVSSGISGTNRESEYRAFIDNNNQPIQQATDFRRIPVTIGVKQYLTSTGRSIGRLAWIPTRLAPYVGAGAGVMYYKFRQAGDFINESTSDVFSSVYESDGWAPTVHGLAGIDYSISPRFALNTEARYLWSNAALSHDFKDFGHLDLSGLSTTIGLSVRF